VRGALKIRVLSILMRNIRSAGLGCGHTSGSNVVKNSNRSSSVRIASVTTPYDTRNTETMGTRLFSLSKCSVFFLTYLYVSKLLLSINKGTMHLVPLLFSFRGLCPQPISLPPPGAPEFLAPR